MKHTERAERFKKARLVYNKNTEKTLEKVYQDTGIMKSLVSDLENEDKDRGVKYQDIAKLAKYYGVSADYLLGLTDDYAIESDTRGASVTTGLSAVTVEYLRKSSDAALKSMIDIMIIDILSRDNENLEDSLLSSMWSYIHLKPESAVVPLDKNTFSARVSSVDAQGNVILPKAVLKVSNADVWDYGRAIYERKIIKVLDSVANGLYENKAEWAVEINNKTKKGKKHGKREDEDK